MIWGELPHGIEYNFGPGFGLTRGSDHVIMKFNVELEHFVGAILGQRVVRLGLVLLAGATAEGADT